MGSGGRPLAILYVEDDENDLYLARHALAKISPELVLAAVPDGEAAREHLSTSPAPDLVLMDLKLPKRTGHELLSWIRGQPRLRSLTVVVLSSSKEKADVERAYALGANSYVSKEGSLKGLREILRGVVTLAEIAREGS